MAYIAGRKQQIPARNMTLSAYSNVANHVAQTSSVRSQSASATENSQKHQKHNTSTEAPLITSIRYRWSSDSKTVQDQQNSKAEPSKIQASRRESYAEDNDQYHYALTSTLSNDSSIYPSSSKQRPLHVRTKYSSSIRDRMRANIASTRVLSHRFTSSKASNNLSTASTCTSLRSASSETSDHPMPAAHQVTHKKTPAIALGQQGQAPKRPLPPPPEQTPDFEALLPVEFYREQLRRNSASTVYGETAELSRYSSLRASVELDSRVSWENSYFRAPLPTCDSIVPLGSSSHPLLTFPQLSSTRFDIQDYIHHLLQSHSHPVIPPTLIHHLTTSGYDLWEMRYTNKPESNITRMEFFTSLLKYGSSPFQVDLLHDEMVKGGKRVRSLGGEEEGERIRMLRSRGSMRSSRHTFFEESPHLRGADHAVMDETNKVGGGIAAREYHNTKRKRAATWPSSYKQLNNGNPLLHAHPVVTVLAPLQQTPTSSNFRGLPRKELHRRVSTGMASLKMAKSLVKDVLEVQLRHG